MPSASHDRTVPETAVQVGDEFSIAVDRIATGGAALGPAPDGRVAFVSGAIPGETVMARVDATHRSRIEATVLSVVEPSVDRRSVQCPHVAQGCGGCDWQHVDPGSISVGSVPAGTGSEVSQVERSTGQRGLRMAVVEDCLRRLGGLEDVDIRPGPDLGVEGYRTTVRAAVVDGRAAYRRRSSNEPVVVDSCLIAHPVVEEVLVDGHFGSATEVVVRAGVETGERMVVVDPTADGVQVPDDVKVVGRDELKAGARPHYHERIAGLRLQISADSFFQCRPDGAAVLAELAGDAVADVEGTMLDAYCGMGLFGALAGIGRSVVGVELNPSAVADARWNYGPHGRVIEADFERWQPEPAAVVIADPARVGLRKAGCQRVAATGATRLALVSCDPASLARDASLLADHGFELDHVTVVDLFGHTSHIETVSRFVR